MKTRSWCLALLAAAIACSPACSDDVEIGENSRFPAVTGGSTGSGGAFGTGGSGGSLACIPRYCKSRLLGCGDCEDNDLDGLIDAADPECLGSCDDRENSFFGGIPVDDPGTDTCRLDCYFDYDSGF